MLYVYQLPPFAYNNRHPLHGLPALPSYANPRIEFAYAIVRQGQSFRLVRPLGEETEGLKTPGY